MPPERLPPDQPAEWLNRARSDLAIAESALPGAYREDLCYHAQQAAEKALKAVYVQRGWRYQYVHDLALLVHGLEQQGLSLPADVREAVVLTEYAVAGRYPGLGEPVTDEEWRESISRAKAVVGWAAAALASFQPPDS